MTRGTSIALGLVWLAGCSAPAGVDCSLIDPFPYSIVVDVVLRPEDPAPSPEEIRGVVQRPDATPDFMTRIASGQLVSSAPLGTYTVEVTAPGFEPWRQDNVRTRAGACGGFDAVELRAELLPEGTVGG